MAKGKKLGSKAGGEIVRAALKKSGVRGAKKPHTKIGQILPKATARAKFKKQVSEFIRAKKFSVATDLITVHRSVTIKQVIHRVASAVPKKSTAKASRETKASKKPGAATGFFDEQRREFPRKDYILSYALPGRPGIHYPVPGKPGIHYPVPKSKPTQTNSVGLKPVTTDLDKESKSTSSLSTEQVKAIRRSLGWKTNQEV